MHIRMIWRYCKNLEERLSNVKRTIFWLKLEIDQERRQTHSLKESFNKSFQSKINKFLSKAEQDNLRFREESKNKAKAKSLFLNNKP